MKNQDKNHHNPADSIRQTIAHLSETIGPRAPGSDAERLAAEYIKTRFSDLGIPAIIEPFDSPVCSVEHSSLAIDGIKERLKSYPSQFSPAGDVSGPLVFLGNEMAALEVDDVDGAVGLLVAGGLHEGGSVERNKLASILESKGLKGLITVTPDERVNTKLMRDPALTRMPVVCVPYSVGEFLKQHTGCTANLSVVCRPQKSQGSQNVVATLPGTCDNWIVLCAHYDSASLSPGACDDASGVAALLEVAKNLAGHTCEANIIFLASGSEEHGADGFAGCGAQDFFKRREQEIDRCIAFLDTNDIGNILGTPEMLVGGPKRFKEIVRNLPKKQRYLFNERDYSHSCDNGAAYQYSVPYLWTRDAALARPHYHSPDDTIKHVDMEAIARYVDDLTLLLKTLAKESPFQPFVQHDGLLVRPARKRDVPAILEITRLAFEPVSIARMQELFFKEKLGGKHWHEYKNRDVEAYCDFNLYTTVVAEKGGLVVGYATYYFYKEQGIAEAGNNAVHPKYQGQKIGKALQAEVKRRMVDEGYTKFTVSTLSVDVPAQKIYEKLGYQRVADTIYYLMNQA